MSQLRKRQRVEVAALLAGDPELQRLRERRRQLSLALGRLTSKPEVLPCPECPVCYDSMKPPARILQCVSGHLVCVECAKRVEQFIWWVYSTSYYTGDCTVLIMIMFQSDLQAGVLWARHCYGTVSAHALQQRVRNVNQS